MHKLSERLAEANRIAILAHVRPDGDAVGSCLALQNALVTSGKEAQVFLADPVPLAFRFLKDSDKATSHFPSLEDVDLCFVLDLPDLSRTGFSEQIGELGKVGKVILIDHHPKGDMPRFSSLVIHDDKASSTCQMIYQLLMEMGLKITPDCATALLTGIFTDTGGFEHANTTDLTLEIAADLMRRGAKLTRIVQEVANSKSVANLKLIGLALERLQVSQDGTCASTAIAYSDMERVGATQDDVTGIMGNLSSLAGLKMSLLLVEALPGVVRGMLRSSDGSKVNVARLARILGGGGHPQASGFSIPGSILIDENGKWQVVKPEKTS